jgi:alkanesulfonate monooxygenase SsuD/methylene tetrahydromethanopterin reductase-like flavin-dependent oxidoreductase (luciferase family)
MSPEPGSAGGTRGAIRVGVLLWSQGTDWPSFWQAAQRIDELGYAHLWTWDHLLPIFGDPAQPIFEGWAAISALAATTRRAEVGLLVTANTFRNPTIVAKAAVTIDHISGGRAVVGLGAGWLESEHLAYGIDFGSSAGQRLDWLEEAAALIRHLLDGTRVDHHGARYQAHALTLSPPPIRTHVPMMIGGVGETKTLRTVARHADLWNAYGDAATLRRKADVLREHCVREQRDPASIEFSVACKPFIRDSERDARIVLERALAQNRTSPADVDADPSFWVGTPERIAERMIELHACGFTTFIAQVPAPYDPETLERFVSEVKPLVEQA